MLGSKAFEPERDINSPNRNIAPISSEINESEKLVVGGFELSELAKKYGTPLYVFDELSLRTACKTYISSLKKHYPGGSSILKVEIENWKIPHSKEENWKIENWHLKQ